MEENSSTIINNVPKTILKTNNKDEYLEEFRKSLPIYQYRDELLNVVKKHPFCIITGDTGSGKTTQIPQYIIESLNKGSLSKNETNSRTSKDIPRIVITQPRRVAVIQMAKRVAYEKNYKLGKEVGYSIRFEENFTDDTLIKFVTDGILVRELLFDKNLSKYNVIILDEAHERSLFTDILFALCKQAVIRRNGDLRLIVTSATLDTTQFSNYFNDCPVFQIGGKIYPVEMIYFTSRIEKKVENSVKLAIRIHLHEGPGHILCFLTGFEECEQACKMCYQKLEELSINGKKIPPLMIMPLYGAQNTDEQAQIFEKAPENCRKLIFSTNIAETSLTVDGIGFVIDCGYVKQKNYNPKTAMDSLSVVPISKTQAVQRAGRAGRTGPGKCIRLYTEQFFESQMQKNLQPEILRINLSSTILTLKSMGIDDVVDFDFMEKPDRDSLLEALKQLFFLQAIDENGKITKLGIEMSKFPIDCAYSRCLIASKLFDVSDDMTTLVSLISCEQVWFNVNKYDEERRANFENKKTEFMDKDSDQMSFLNIYKEWEYNNFSEVWCKENFLHFRTLRHAKKIKEQLNEYLNKVHFKECENYFSVKNIKGLREEVDTDKMLQDYDKINCLVRMSLCQGFFMNAAKKTSNVGDVCSYLRISDGSLMTIDDNSSISIKNNNPDLILFTELGGYSNRPMMKQVSVIKLNWISDLIYLLKKVDVLKLRGKIIQPNNNLMKIYDKNEINLYELIENKCNMELANEEYETNLDNYWKNNLISKEESNQLSEADDLRRKAEEAKNRYLKRKTDRK